MMQVTAEGLGNGQVDRFPDECPVCRIKISPLYKFGKTEGKSYSADLECVFLCTNDKCKELFIGYYNRDPRTSALNFNGKLRPIEAIAAHIPSAIEPVSTSFCSIYKQAHKAEELGLSEICGVGYRKSVEFLIKDYAIKKYPEKEAEIKSEMLGPCIRKFVDDLKVKEVANRATWLGNDETHYKRRWIDKDLSDLKLLIRLALHWIEMDLLTDEALASMPPKGSGEQRNGKPM